MSPAVPLVVRIWDPEINDYTLADFWGEHGDYYAYISRASGRILLVLKGEVWKFAVE